MLTAILIICGLMLAVALAPAMIAAEGIGQYLPEKTIVATNRTGVATVVGGIYTLDILQVDGASTTPELGACGVIAVATANLKSPKVIATRVLADNEAGTFVLQSPDVEILVEGTTDVVKGNLIIPVDAANHVKNQSTAVTVCAVGFAWVTQASATPTLTRCCFDGLAPCFSSAPAS